MGRPQDDELSGLRSELEGDPELADTFARLEPGPNSGGSTSGMEFADPLAGLVPLDPPEPSTKLRPASSASSLPKLHGEEEGDRDTPTQRYVKTLHDLPDPSTRRVASDPAPAAAESKPLRTPSSYVGRIPRAPVSSPGGASTVPAGVPMRRPSAQNPMLSYSGSGKSLPDSAPLNPMGSANRLAAPTESQAARTVPVPEGHIPFPNSFDERPRTSTLPGAKAVSDSQSVPSTAVSPYAASAPVSSPLPLAEPATFSPSLEAQESTDAGVSAPAEVDGPGGDEDEGGPQKSSGRAAIYLAVGIFSAAATLAVLLFVLRPMRAGAGAVEGSPALSASVVVVAPSVSAVGADNEVKGAELAPQGSGTAASITADPVFVSGSASSPVVASALPSVSAAVNMPSVSSSAPVVVVVPVPSPVPSMSVKAQVPATAPVPKPSASSPKPSSSKVSPIFDF